MVSVEEMRPGLFCIQGQLEVKTKTNNANIHHYSDSDEEYYSTSFSSTNTALEKRECQTDFVINKQPYDLIVFLNKTNKDITANLKLVPKTEPCPAAKKAKMTKKPEQKTASFDKDVELFYVWASIEEKIIVTLNNTDQQLWSSSSFLYRKLDSYSLYGNPFGQQLKISLWLDFGTPASKNERQQLSQIASLFTNQRLCDVTFKLQEKETIGAHVAILSAASPVFAAMFQHDLKETKTRTVQINDIKPKVFKLLLSYTYDGKTGCLDNEDVVQQLLEAANKYDVKRLKEECELHLKSSFIRVENVLALLVFAEKYSCPRLYESATAFAVKHSQQICFQDKWKELMAEHRSICLQLTQLMAKKSQSSSTSESAS